MNMRNVATLYIGFHLLQETRQEMRQRTWTFLRRHRTTILQNIIRCWIFNTTQAVAPRVGVASWYYCAASATPLSAVTK